MRGNRSRDIRPEVAIRSALHRVSPQFRKQYTPLPGGRIRVDVAFPRSLVVARIGSCFWHGYPEHGNQPIPYSDYLLAKLQRNVERDMRTDQVLVEAGWVVMRFWEHEKMGDIVAAVRSALRDSASSANTRMPSSSAPMPSLRRHVVHN